MVIVIVFTYVGVFSWNLDQNFDTAILQYWPSIYFCRQANFQLKGAGSPRVVSESQKGVLDPRIVPSSLLGRWTKIITMCLSSVDRQQVMLRWAFLNPVAW